MTRRSVGSRYSSISLGASTLRHNLDTEVLMKVPKLVAHTRRVARMLDTRPAAATGCVRMKKMRNATRRKPTILRRFTDNHRSAPGEGPLTRDLYRTDRIGGIRRAGPNVAIR